jgi:hypothetical protein
MTVYLFGRPFPIEQARTWSNGMHIMEQPGGPIVIRTRTAHVRPPKPRTT